MSLIDNLKKELAAHPELYDNKTSAEIAGIINNPIKQTVTVEVPDIVITVVPTKQVQQEVILEAPVLRVINGVPGAPNLITEADITEARK